MPTNIHNLSDLSMLDIFGRLSVADLFVAGQVCSRFMHFRGLSAKSRYALTLLICPEYCVPLYIPRIENIESAHLALLLNEDGSRIFYEQKSKQELFQINGIISVELAEFVAKLFPEILNLDINVEEAISTKNLDGLIKLLKLYAKKVTRLRINLKYDEKFDYNLVDNIRPHVGLLSAINSMTALKSLEFHYSGTLTEDRNTRIEMPVLDRLEEFTFTGFGDFFGGLTDSFTSFAVTNSKLTKIALSSIALRPNIWTDFLKDKPKFGARFSNISLVINHSDGNLLKPLFDQLLNLTSIAIVFNSPLINLYELYRSLSALRQLVHIKFVGNGNDLNVITLRGFENNIQNANQYPPLTSVKVITFQISYNAAIITHGLFDDFHLGDFFPLVEIVHFTRQPVLCRVCAVIHEFEFDICCFGEVIRTFQMAFSQLKTVFVNNVTVDQIKYVIAGIQGVEVAAQEDQQHEEDNVDDGLNGED